MTKALKVIGWQLMVAGMILGGVSRYHYHRGLFFRSDHSMHLAIAAGVGAFLAICAGTALLIAADMRRPRR